MSRDPPNGQNAAVFTRDYKRDYEMMQTYFPISEIRHFDDSNFIKLCVTIPLFTDNWNPIPDIGNSNFRYRKCKHKYGYRKFHLPISEI